MKLVKTLSVLALLSTAAITARADAFFQASLWAPEPQLVPATADVSGIRLQIYGENRNVTGLDIGFAHSTTGDFVGLGGLFTLYNHVGGTTHGVQWGLVNYTEGAVVGWQAGWINVSQASLTGLQSGLVNWINVDNADLTGVQLGIINAARHVTGVQLGFINYAETLKGLQIGLWNQVNSREWDEFKPLPKVFPFINVGF
ncbi:MAG: hypothetical protein JF599_03775 [Verrucomicrobia bacterium]|nr:hypothetical protein [Verrucomicrobiota bacterium]